MIARDMVATRDDMLEAVRERHGVSRLMVDLVCGPMDRHRVFDDTAEA